MSNRRQAAFLFIVCSALLLSAVVAARGWHRKPESAGMRNSTQTSNSGPVEEAPVINYGIIWDGKLSRSGMPKDESEWRWLRAQGVNTIVNLRQDNDVDYGKYGFESFLWIPLQAGDPLTNEDAEKFLRFIQDVDSHPVNIQDVEGKFHTVMVTALARYAVDGWAMDEALGEAERYLKSEELPARQLDWLRTWAATHKPGSHRKGGQ